jgi:hypothetical protein
MSGWVAGAVAVGTIGGAIISSQGAKSAAKTQADAAGQATDAQRQIFERQVELQAPFREAGLSGQNRLLELLGLSTKPTALGADATQEEKDQYAKELADYNALIGSKDFGKYASAEFGADKFKADPSYAFRMSEGMKALERSAASRGGLLSGATLKGIQRYGQDLASTEYQNAFNRYQAERTGTLNPFQALAGVGQSSANTLGQQAGAYGNAMASNIIGAGNAQAAGQIGSANAFSSGLGQGINFYQNQQLLNRMPTYNAASASAPSVIGGGF